MVRLDLLRDHIEESGMTITAIARKSGISRQTMYNRIYGKSEFKASEIVAICKVMHLTDKERDLIFFSV
jgi:predicted transcriptional regulator